MTDPLATKSSYIWYSIPLSGCKEKLGPFNVLQTSFVSVTNLIVSIIGLDISLDTKISWFGWTSIGNGSYNLAIIEPSLPVHVVITLLSPAGKCNKCVKYFDVSFEKIESSNWDVKISAILLTAKFLGIWFLPLLKLILIISVLPITSSTPLILYGTNFKINEIEFTSSDALVPLTFKRVFKFNSNFPSDFSWMNVLESPTYILTKSVFSDSYSILKSTFVPE